MLNARLYRTSWLVAGVALVVALLTLQSPAPAPAPLLPPAFDGAAAQVLAGELSALAPSRPPGSVDDVQAADWIRRQLADLPGGAVAGGGSRVAVQDFTALADGVSYRLRNVYLAVPASGAPVVPGGLLVVAPRDTPPGVSGGASGSAMLVELARLSATIAHHRPLLFVSTDGSTLGNAGMRWFLSRFSGFPLGAAVVLDAPGEARGVRVHVWDDGRSASQSLAMSDLATAAVARASGTPVGEGSVGSQLLRLAVPQTFGDQGVLVAAGVPAATLSGRPETPLPARAPEPTRDRLTLVGNAAQGLVGSLDAADRVATPDASVGLAGKVLRPSIIRIALLLLALPILVLAVDAFARLRRAHVRAGPGLRAVGWRIAPALAALVAAHLLVLAGLLPGTSAGAPPLPDAVPFDAVSAVGVLAAVAVGVLAARIGRRRVAQLGAEAPAEAAGALTVLAVLLVVLWWALPFGLVLALPAAHAALVATVARRRWQVAALAVVAVLPLVLLCVHIGGILDRGPFFAAWYLMETAASGAREGWGPVAFVAVAGAIWALGGLVAFRARKGLVAATGPAAPAERPARRRPPGAR